MLHGEHGLALKGDAAIGVIEQRNVSFFDALGQAFPVNREAMVHRHDLDLVGGEILDRMIGAVMALVHFLGRCTQCQPQHLVTKANAKHRQAASD